MAARQVKEYSTPGTSGGFDLTIPKGHHDLGVIVRSGVLYLEALVDTGASTASVRYELYSDDEALDTPVATRRYVGSGVLSGAGKHLFRVLT